MKELDFPDTCFKWTINSSYPKFPFSYYFRNFLYVLKICWSIFMALWGFWGNHEIHVIKIPPHLTSPLPCESQRRHLWTYHPSFKFHSHGICIREVMRGFGGRYPPPPPPSPKKKKKEMSTQAKEDEVHPALDKVNWEKTIVKLLLRWS